ncbi:MAG TPA: hypothetical protein VL173_17195 [Vicinamibacterales bacterium]|nr:hypothetical protein [Vicinamibacterales bacterium]
MRLTHGIGIVIVTAAVAALALLLKGNQDPMTPLAERYVKLVLALGQHDADYVDAYYGPAAWKEEAARAKKPLDAIDAEAHAVRDALRRVTLPAGASELERLRHEYLTRQVEALGARAAMLSGTRLDFDEESKALYDAVAPMHTEGEFEQTLQALDRELPGSGPLLTRYDAFRARFVIPKDRLDATFRAAIDGCRSRTLQHVKLPPGETFTLEYVTGKSWSGYNWYQGHYHSLIQVNTDLPIYVDRAIDLACHEGYPGHHVYNVLLEQNLVRNRGWTEFTIYPLFSPQSLIAEGTANYGIDVAFPTAERREFERRTIFPAAGLDPAQVDRYYDVQALVDRLSYAGNEAARRYLNGDFDRAAAADWLERFALMSPPRAEQRVKFFDQYRSYVINYNLGKDLIAKHIEAETQGSSDPNRRWDAFVQLLSSPRLPSGLSGQADASDDVSGAGQP